MAPFVQSKTDKISMNVSKLSCKLSNNDPQIQLLCSSKYVLCYSCEFESGIFSFPALLARV